MLVYLSSTIGLLFALTLLRQSERLKKTKEQLAHLLQRMTVYSSCKPQNALEDGLVKICSIVFIL